MGDKVLTHTGEIRSITKTIINPNEEHMITLKPANAPAVTMTGDPPYFLIWTDDTDDRETIITSELPEGDGYKWVAARDVRVNSNHVVFVGQNITTEVSELFVEDFIELLPARNGKNSVDRKIMLFTRATSSMLLGIRSSLVGRGVNSQLEQLL